MHHKNMSKLPDLATVINFCIGAFCLGAVVWFWYLILGEIL